MPKLLITLCCLIVFCAFASKAYTSKQKNELENGRLNGKVKSCTVYSHEISDPNFLKVFNSNVKQSINTKFYDRQGYCTKTLNSIIDKNDKVIHYSSITNNAKTRLAASLAQKKIVYNKIGQRDSIFGINKAGKLTLVDVFQYDQKSNLLIAYIYINNDANANVYIGKKVYKVLYKYDKFNNLVEELNLDKKGERVSKTNYRYDSRGNELLRVDSGVKRIGNSNELKKAINNTYTVSYIYKNFDKAGNWLQQIMIVNNERSYSIKRRIKYYN